MSHEHETLNDAPVTVDRAPQAESEPDYILRARRILSGDIRPDDYLTTTPEVEAGVALDLAYMTDHVRKQFEAGRIPAMFEPDPSVEHRQRVDRLLSEYYGGQNIACIENDRGVIVLAVGLEQSAAVINAFPYEQRKDVGLCTPDPPDGIWM